MYEYENLPDNDKEEYRVMSTPKFLSSPQTILVNEGDTIRLPCKVDRLEGFVMLWKRNNDIITVGDQIIDKSVRLEKTTNGNSIVIGPASPEDEAVRNRLTLIVVTCTETFSVVFNEAILKI